MAKSEAEERRKPGGKGTASTKAKAQRAKVHTKKHDDHQDEERDPEELIKRTIERRLAVVNKLPSINARHLLKEADKDERTALQLAVVHKHADLVALLLEAKADVIRYDKNQNTTLHAAVMNKDERVVVMLLDAGVKYAAKNSAGKTAKDIAEDPHIRGLIDKFEVTKALPEKADFSANPLQDRGRGSKARPVFRVRIENLPMTSTHDLLEDEIRALFRRLGANNPLSLEVGADAITSRPKGFAYVEFQDAAAADLCVTGDGSIMNGSKLRIFRETAASTVKKR